MKSKLVYDEHRDVYASIVTVELLVPPDMFRDELKKLIETQTGDLTDINFWKKLLNVLCDTQIWLNHPNDISLHVCEQDETEQHLHWLLDNTAKAKSKEHTTLKATNGKSHSHEKATSEVKPFRAHDHKTYAERKLTPEALSIKERVKTTGRSVQKGMLIFQEEYLKMLQLAIETPPYLWEEKLMTPILHEGTAKDKQAISYIRTDQKTILTLLRDDLNAGNFTLSEEAVRQQHEWEEEWAHEGVTQNA